MIHQEKALQEMGTISTPFYLKDYPEQAKKAVEGKELIESLNSLAFLDKPINVSELRKGAEKSAELHPFTFMISFSSMSFGANELTAIKNANPD